MKFGPVGRLSKQGFTPRNTVERLLFFAHGYTAELKDRLSTEYLRFALAVCLLLRVPVAYRHHPISPVSFS